MHFTSLSIIFNHTNNMNWYFHSYRLFAPNKFGLFLSSGIASCVGTAGTMTWRLHLTWPWCVALGRVLIWVLSPDWFLLLRDRYCNPKRGFKPGFLSLQLCLNIVDYLKLSATTAVYKFGLFQCELFKHSCGLTVPSSRLTTVKSYWSN